jgi:hypothetical protein
MHLPNNLWGVTPGVRERTHDISSNENRTSLKINAYHGVIFTTISARSDLLASKQGFFK